MWYLRVLWPWAYTQHGSVLLGRMMTKPWHTGHSLSPRKKPWIDHLGVLGSAGIAAPGRAQTEPQDLFKSKPLTFHRQWYWTIPCHIHVPLRKNLLWGSFSDGWFIFQYCWRAWTAMNHLPWRVAAEVPNKIGGASHWIRLNTCEDNDGFRIA